MDKDSDLEDLAELLTDAESSIKEDADKQVEIEHCINIKKMYDYKVSCSYQDIVFIICILKNYLKLTSEKEGHIWDYYRDRFTKLADKLSVQIDYDYEKQLEKCRKKLNAKEKQDDVGEEAMALIVKRGEKSKGKGGGDGKPGRNPKKD